MKNDLKQVYLVGGAVRDQLLGLDSKDKDYVVVGETAKKMLSLGFTSVGSDFPVFLHPVTKDEYALARTERKSGKGYTGFTVDAATTVTLEEDLARRDLTINSMARDNENNIIDPFNGQQDLENKVLKHTTLAFVEDPVRVLRVARFLARYGSDWHIHADTISLMRALKHNGELNNLVAERIWKETEKALGEKYPDLYFRALDGLGIFPELEVLKQVYQDDASNRSVFEFTMDLIKQAAHLNLDSEVRFSLLTFRLNKQENVEINSNEVAEDNVIATFCERLKMPNRYRDLALLSSKYFNTLNDLLEKDAKQIHVLLISQLNVLTHPQRFNHFIQVCQCLTAKTQGNIYREGKLAKQLYNALMDLDKKQLVQQALKDGKKGKEIGEAVKVAEIQCINEHVNFNG